MFGSNNIVLHNLCHHVVFSFPDFPANTTLQPIPGLMLLTEVCLNPGLFCFVLHTTLWSVCQMNSQLIFAAPYPTLALAFNTYTLLTSSPSPTVPFFPITYQQRIRHSSPLTQLMFVPYLVFESCHNIRNQPVSTAIPSPSSFRDITTIGKHQHLGEILKDVFFLCFLRQYCIQINTAKALPALVFIRTHKNQFICTVTTSFSVHYCPKNFEFQSGQIQVLSHTIPKALYPPTTYAHPNHQKYDLLHPISTGQEATYLEYLIGSILNIVSQKTYHTHYQLKNSLPAVQYWIRAQYNKV